MELLKLDERPAEYQYGDVTIFFRPQASNGDKFTLDTAGELNPDGTMKIEGWRFYKDIIRLFVTGWKGVTENGAEVPYSFETLVDRLPTQGEDLIIKLGIHIADVTGILKLKNGDTPEKNA